ncbi:hypothetical protein DDE18_01145 [Nocardioides gansuensis]|uniref:Uncharacterized protein n=1 Tax=Nocardioides gansuensis TaxID=2138300 RepID=A0A2T8FEZ7_9ACTN|nr:hypothetical protein [Nocardioides gansuensis]PVG84269.1 hypothetical protein DDE18_01145 [Nocardioides gansuensis]
MTTVAEIQARLEALYRAGRLEFPDKASDVKAAADRLEAATDRLNGLSAQVGDAAVLVDALQVCYDVHLALSRTVQTLNDCAAGLIHIADDFARTDDQAQQAFDQINRALRDGPPPPQVGVPVIPDPTPEGDGDEYTSVPEPEAPEDDLEERDDRTEEALPDQREIPS